MKVTEHIRKANGKTLFSFEILPPKKGENINSIFDTIVPLMDFNPAFIDVTYHREEYIFKERENGLLERKVIRKRPGTVAICAAIKNKFQVDTVPHLICGGFTKSDTEYALLDLSFLEIDNILVLRGDSLNSEKEFKPEPNGHEYASELLQQIANINKGVFLDESFQTSFSTDFCIGVAGYPEKHFESPNKELDIHFLKKKIELGADYIVTQLFYDNSKYFNFVEQCRNAGITVPIIPGIKPISIKRHLTLLPNRFHIDIPPDLSHAIYSSKDNNQAYEVGVEWAIQQCKELIQFGVPAMHFYTMGNANNISAIAKAVF